MSDIFLYYEDTLICRINEKMLSTQKCLYTPNDDKQSVQRLLVIGDIAHNSHNINRELTGLNIHVELNNFGWILHRNIIILVENIFCLTIL